MSGVRGDREVRRALQQLGNRAPTVVGNALFSESLPIFTESQTQVPVDTGFLKSGGYITPPAMNSNGAHVEIGYTAPYAPEVHENLSARHAPPTKSKFLSDPLNAATPGFRNRLMTRLRSVLGL